VVTGIWETGAADVLVLAGPDGGERLVPASLLRRVDSGARRLVIELLPGLFDEPGTGAGEG
jgi:ribosomal 30S subunit maturation factor RimM